jgi:hypothetical protein
MAVPFLLVGASSLNGCALFGSDYNVIGAERCPVMTEEAEASWGEVYPLTEADLRVWMGEEDRLGD